MAPFLQFDMSINLGHVLTAATFLTSAVIGFASMDARITKTDESVRRIEEKEIKGIEAKVQNVETRILSRISDERAMSQQLQSRVVEDIREMKIIVRDGFKNLDVKLDGKADKGIVR
jgi:hypothetical protein